MGTKSGMKRNLFGTDGIRGLANSLPMTPEIALKVGMAAGRIFTKDLLSVEEVFGWLVLPR